MEGYCYSGKICIVINVLQQKVRSLSFSFMIICVVLCYCIVVCPSSCMETLEWYVFINITATSLSWNCLLVSLMHFAFPKKKKKNQWLQKRVITYVILFSTNRGGPVHYTILKKGWCVKPIIDGHQNSGLGLGQGSESESWAPMTWDHECAVKKRRCVGGGGNAPSTG